MTMTSVVLTALLLTAPAVPAQKPSVPAAKTPAEQELVVEGELENYIVVGGETTGWRLRRRNAQGRREYIEVLLTAEVAQGVRANSRVQVRGTMKTRHYPERGDVNVIVARSVIEVARLQR